MCVTCNFTHSMCVICKATMTLDLGWNYKTSRHFPQWEALTQLLMERRSSMRLKENSKKRLCKKKHSRQIEKRGAREWKRHEYRRKSEHGWRRRGGHKTWPVWVEGKESFEKFIYLSERLQLFIKLLIIVNKNIFNINVGLHGEQYSLCQRKFNK